MHGGGVVTTVMSKQTSQLQGEFCKLAEICKQKKLLSGIALSVYQEINRTGTSPHGISGVAVLVDQHIAKNMPNSKIPQKNKQFKNLQFSKVSIEIQQNTNSLLTMFRISSTILQKVSLVALVHSFMRLLRFWGIVGGGF